MHRDINMQDTESVSDGKKQDGMPGRKRKKWVVLTAICCIAAIAVIAVRAGGKRNDMQAVAIFHGDRHLFRVLSGQQSGKNGSDRGAAV